MTRIDAPLVRSTSLVETNPTSTSDSSFQLVARSGTPASASSTSAAGSLVAPAPLGARRDPADVFADTNVMTISQSGPISITLDGKNAQYDNGLMVLKLDERGAVIGVDPVFADSTNPGKSVSMDVRRGDRIAFVAVPDGGASQATRDLMSNEDNSFALTNKKTGRPANLLTDNPADLALFARDEDGQRTEIKGRDGLTFNIKRSGADGQGFNAGAMTLDPETGKVKVGMDDQLNGDNDRDDIKFTVDLGRQNTRALTLDSDEPAMPRTFRELAGMDNLAGRGELLSLFERADRSGNDSISQSEWNRAARSLGLDSDDLAYFRDQGIRSPQELAEAILDEADADGDGKISRRELRDLKRTIDEEQEDSAGLPRTFQQLAGVDARVSTDELLSLFEQADRSGNDSISQSEWNRAARSLGLDAEDLAYFRDQGIRSPEDLAEAISDLADKNGDGVSRRELRELKEKIADAREAEEAIRSFGDIAGMNGLGDADEIAAALRSFDGSAVTDANGLLGRAEWGNVAPLLSMGPDGYDFLRERGVTSFRDFGEEIVSQADTNGDRQVSKAELKALAEKIEAEAEEE